MSAFGAIPSVKRDSEERARAHKTAIHGGPFPTLDCDAAATGS